MKLFPLVLANLKGFVRNWRMVFLLIVLPLLLISTIFLAFNPTGLTKINLGYSVESQTINEQEFSSAIDSFAHLTRYNTSERCTEALQAYKEYACLDITGSGPYTVNVLYDNTREPVIWEVIERIKQGIQYVQQQHSKEMAAGFLAKFNGTLGKLDTYEQSLTSINNDLNAYSNQIDVTVTSMQQANADLETTLRNMDADIQDAQQTNAEGRSQAKMYTGNTRQQLSYADSIIATIPAPNGSFVVQNARNQISAAQVQVNSIDSAIDNTYTGVNNRIAMYVASSAKGKDYSQELTSSTAAVQQKKQDLAKYQRGVAATRNDLHNIKQEFSGLATLDPETLVNPVVIYNNPAYVPHISGELPAALQNATDAEKLARGASFLSLQTMFPAIVILIMIFLSLLISNFVCLLQINANAYTRVRLVHRIFFTDFLATLLSAFIIIFIPSLIIMIGGDQLFRLGVINHLLPILVLLFLFVSIFAVFGLLLAYSLRKESITLMVTTFILVLIVFLSGFLLPIERMSPTIAMIALINPATIVLTELKKVLFYNASFGAIQPAIVLLLIEFALLLCVTLLVKWLKER